MADVVTQFRRGKALAILSCALAGLVWVAPVSDYPSTTKARLVAQTLDAIITPLIDLIGKPPLLIALGVMAVFGLAHGFGLQLRLPRPSAPSFAPIRTTADDDNPIDTPVAPLNRRRGLAQIADAGLQEVSAVRTPEAVPPARNELEQKMRETLGEDFELTPEIERRARELAAEWQRRGNPDGERVDPVAIVRKRRENDRDWSNDRSWFGGLPRLGGAAWPRGKTGLPLPFVAQIDLAEIAATNPDTPLPTAGSMAFFVKEGAVVYVPPGDHPPTPAPRDLLPAYQEDSYPFPEVPSNTCQLLFPFWPVEPIRLRLPDDLPPISENEDHLEVIEGAQMAALEQVVTRRRYAFSTAGKLSTDIAGVDAMWWYGADLVLRQLQTSLDEMPRAIARHEKWIAEAQDYQARLVAEGGTNEKELAISRAGEARNRAAIPAIEEEGRQLAEFVSRFAEFVAGRDLWSEMTGEEIDVLKSVIGKARHEYEHLCRYNVVFSIDNARDATIRRMITGDARAAAALPDAVLALLNDGYRLPSNFQHQMFGLGGCRQYARYDHLCDHLLLQIVYDDLPEFRFGDMGLWQFWMAPEDLAAGRWDKVQLTFECS